MSASRRENVLTAVRETDGLDIDTCIQFLESQELSSEIIQQYNDNVHLHGIISIPLFLFHLPQIGVSGGPFREAGSGRMPWKKQGSNTPEAFFMTFESIYREYQARHRLGGLI